MTASHHHVLHLHTTLHSGLGHVMKRFLFFLIFLISSLDGFLAEPSGGVFFSINSIRFMYGILRSERTQRI
jgi:hypothetical protein